MKRKSGTYACHPVRKAGVTRLPAINDVIGAVPYRMAFAGGWIDQPFVSRLNPEPPGSMVVAALKPSYPFMDRCGMATSTRKAAIELWGGTLPDRPPSELIKELYRAENEGKKEPSGSQDMAGLVYPGINRLDYDADYEGGYFPCNVESCVDAAIASWLEQVLWIIPIAPRPEGYNPLGVRNLNREWVNRLGRTGKDCYDAIVNRDTRGLGASFNECMTCWEAILPQTVVHPAITADLKGIMRYYQRFYEGAMYSGCGGGYLFVVSEAPVPGGMKPEVLI